MSSSYVPAESLLQSRAFRRLFGWSLAGHLIVYLSLVIHPFRGSELIAATPVMVQMVDMPKTGVPKPAPARPAPKPPEAKPVEPPKPEPPKPVVKEIVIPKEPAPLAKPKPKPTAPPPSAEELIAKMTERVEAEEAANAPPEAPAAEEAPAATEFSPGRFDPILSPWLASVKARVRANWSGASVCRGQSQFDVDIDAGGQLTNISLAQSSGDRYCDDTVERALRKSNPLPPPPHAMSFVFAFDPKEMQ